MRHLAFQPVHRGTEGRRERTRIGMNAGINCALANREILGPVLGLNPDQPYLDWAKRNLCHNSIDPAAHHFCRGDTFHWLRRFAKQGRRFDGIVLDPPTFSRDEKGKVFRVEENFGELAALAADLLTPDGWLLCSTNCRNLPLNEFQRQLRSAIHRPMSARHSGMPADFSGDAYLKSVWLR